MDSCTQTTYSGPDSGAATVTGTCTDKAGNRSAPTTLGFQYDSTAPSVVATPGRQPDANGWYDHALTVSFSGADATSGIDSCAAPKTYSGPDAAAAVVSGTCTDKAGNVGSVQLGLEYDSTPPLVTATPGRTPDSTRWYNHPLTVSFSAVDGLSGIDSCVAPQTYSGPDTGTGSINGSCQDEAGNVGTVSFPLAYDSTPPDTSAMLGRGPDANGWYDRPVKVSFDGSDGTSGIASCTQEKTYSGPDTGSASVSGSCTDMAGNVDSATASFRYDSTAPLVVGTPSRPPDSNGWYNHAVSVSFSGTDDISGVGSCSQATYSGPDDGAASVGGTCTDKAGNTGTGFRVLEYDATAPVVTATAGRAPDANGWYNHRLRISFSGKDATSGVVSCAPQSDYSGPDDGAASVGGTCTDNAGNTGTGSFALKYDATAPTSVAATPGRTPDSNGWYNHPLTFQYDGSDATSGIASCTRVTYTGPDSSKASVSGTCSDRAGNTSAAVSSTFQYDSTPPSVDDLTVAPGNRTAVVRWSVSPDTTGVILTRSAGTKPQPVTVYRGTDAVYRDRGLTDGVRYRYTVTAVDSAGNTASASAEATPMAPLYSPIAGARLTRPPRLAWKPAPKAQYYNVQVWRHGKIFSAWPTKTSLRLRRHWTFEGRRYRLAPGRYRWYVWPGFGARNAKRYGRMLGSSSFVIGTR
ncbi:MAG: hypothetical protein ACXVRJ_01115 [Gaiellaceae bacterium]